jgi:predicted  nucleic acid-binding Zn-ribbon protein
MKKELKKTIFETVSTLRNLFMTLKVQLEGSKSEKGRLQRELQDTKKSIERMREKRQQHSHREAARDL